NILLITLGLAVVIGNALLYAFRADSRTVNLPYGFSVVEVGPAFLSVPRVIGFAVAIAVAIALYLLMRFTDIGKAIRAVAKEKLGAELSGIDVAHIYAVTFGVGTACLAIAACLLLPTYYVNPHAGNAFVLVAFTIVVLGGMGSVAGALLGGLIIGVVESLCGLYLGDSFGHAAFFGTGAYVTAILQVRYGVNAWAGLVIGIAAGALVGAITGALSFRSGLRGSYFALVTLAFAEVLRIIASVAPITGAGVGTLVKLDLRPEALQFQSRAVFYWVILALVVVSLVIAWLVECSRFGAYLIAVRENEDAAQALGVDATRVKLGAMTLSAAITAAAGCFYTQYFLFLDAGIAYGPWISVEALLTAIIGGVGTILGPLLGALVVRSLGEAARLVTGDAPGLDLVIYGAVLVVVVWFAPRGLMGLVADVRAALARSSKPAGEASHD